MRYQLYALACYATLACALQLPNLQPFLSAIPKLSLSDYIPPAHDTDNPPSHPAQTTTLAKQPQSQPQLDLFRRQDADTCPSGYNNCSNIGAPGLCCSPNARCSADAAGHVACCPRGAACTGSIGGAATAGSTDSEGGFAAATSSDSGDSGLLVTASTTAGATATDDGEDGLQTSNGFVMDGGQTVATPGAGVRGVEAPLVARAVIRLLEFLPV